MAPVTPSKNKGEIDNGNGFESEWRGTDSGRALRSKLALISVLYSPAETFRQYKKEPKFWLKLILLSLVLGLFSYLSFLILPDTMMSELEEELPPELMDEKMMAAASVLGGVSAALGGAIGFFVLILVTAFFLFMLTRLAQWDLSYKEVLAITTLAQAPVILYSLINLIASAITGELTSVTSLAFLAVFSSGAETGSFLYHLLISIDLFTIWSYVLMGFGLAIFAGAALRKGILLSLGYWLVSTFVLSLFSTWIQGLIPPM